MILSAYDLMMIGGWRKIEPQECCLCGYKPPPFELTPQNDPRQLSMLAYWRGMSTAQVGEPPALSGRERLYHTEH